MHHLTKWLNRLTKYACLLVGCFPLAGFAQTLNLDQAYQLARDHYPLIKQMELVKQTSDLNISNLSTGYLPQLSFSAQATYQSEVTSLNIPVPGVKIEPLSKDQYKLLADVNQVIYDGGLVKQQQALQQLTARTELQKVEVELYKLKERIIQVYLSILMLDAQIKQVALVRADIETGIRKVEAQVQNGTAFRSNLNTLKAELLKTDQHKIELATSRKGMVDVLALFINQPLPPDIILEKRIGSNAIPFKEIRAVVA